MLMVLRQPDLGTSLTYLPIAVMGLFLGGVRFKQAAIVTWRWPCSCRWRGMP